MNNPDDNPIPLGDDNRVNDQSGGSAKGVEQISNDGARQLLDQMIRLGYFHSNNKDIQKSSSLSSSSSATTTAMAPPYIRQRTSDSLDTFRKLQKDPMPTFSASDVHCEIILSTTSEDGGGRGGGKDNGGDNEDNDNNDDGGGKLNNLNNMAEDQSSSSPSSSTSTRPPPPPQSGRVYTRQGFIHALTKVLNQQGGRCHRNELSKLLKVDPIHLSDSSPILMSGLLSSSSSSSAGTTLLPLSIQVLRPNELVSDMYWKNLRELTKQQLKDHNGTLNVLDLISQYNVPMELFVNKCLSSKTIKKNENDDVDDDDDMIYLIGTKRLISYQYLNQMKVSVLQTFPTLTEPILISSLCQEQNWDLDLVLEWITGKSMDEIGGVVHMDHSTVTATTATTTTSGGSHAGSSSKTTAMFLPQIYTQEQHKAILDFVSSNGYMTADRAATHGMSMSQVATVVKESVCSSSTTTDDNENISDIDTLRNDDEGNDKNDIKTDNKKNDSNILVLGNVLILEHRILQILQVAIQEMESYSITKNDGNDTNNVNGNGNGATSSIVELQDYLPIELIRTDILQPLLHRLKFYDTNYENHENKKNKNNNTSIHQGIIVIIDTVRACLIHNHIIDDINRTILPSLIQSYAKIRAKELLDIQSTKNKNNDDDNLNDPMIDDDIPTQQQGKHGKSKSRKGKRSTGGSTSSKHKSATSKAAAAAASSYGVVPLLQVAGAIQKAYPMFIDEDFGEEQLLERADEFVSWENDDDDDGGDGKGGTGNGPSSGILVIEFCKQALYNDTFITKCQKAVKAELQRLESTKRSKATVSRKDAASKVRSVEAAFEEVHADICYLIQTQVKFYESVKTMMMTSSTSTSSPTSENQSQEEELNWSHVEMLERELLEGCCADFTSRITQYCLFKNEEESIFTFQQRTKIDNSSMKKDNDNNSTINDEHDHDDDDDEDDNDITRKNILPACCEPVNIINVPHGGKKKVFLSCPPPREPLPVLRESLPSNMGITLARQWILCGGTCYRGGTRQKDDDNNKEDDDIGIGTDSSSSSVYVRPGNLDGFLKHVQENCL